MPQLFIEVNAVEMSMDTDQDGIADYGLGYHLYLVYKDDEGREFVLRGGNNQGIIELELGVPMDESFDERVHSAEFYGQRLIMSGDAAANAWAILLQHGAQIQDQEIPYETKAIGPNGINRNSNSVVKNLLDVIGIDLSQVMPTPQFTTLFGYIGEQTSFHFQYSLNGTIGGDTLVGREGRQVLHGGPGEDALHGRGGDDELRGGADIDILVGGLGNDVLYGDGAGDFIYGEGGNDIIYGDEGADNIDGGADFDTLNYVFSPAGIRLVNGQAYGGYAEGDAISGIERVVGTMHEDAFSGAGIQFYGLNGNDIYLASTGGFFDAGMGVDTISFINSSQVTFDARDGSNSLNITYVSVEEIVGSPGADTFHTSPAFTIRGGGGIDTFHLSAGGVAFGDAGNDVFVVSETLATINGGSDHDKLIITGFAFDHYNMATGVYQNGDATSASVTGIEEVVFDWGKVTGTSGEDIIRAGWGVTVVQAGGGDDYITGNSGGGMPGPQGLYGGSGDDTITSFGADYVYGEGDSDILVGGSRTMVLSGGSGDDFIYANPEAGRFTEVFAGTGVNEIHGNGTGFGIEVKYNFTRHSDLNDGGHLISAIDRGDHFEVTTTLGVDKIYGIGWVYFLSTTPGYWTQFVFEAGMNYVNPDHIGSNAMLVERHDSQPNEATLTPGTDGMGVMPDDPGLRYEKWVGELERPSTWDTFGNAPEIGADAFASAAFSDAPRSDWTSFDPAMLSFRHQIGQTDFFIV